MGDRVSISFRKGAWESVALFSHWGGMDFVNLARQYVLELRSEQTTSSVLHALDSGKTRAITAYPLDRLEPDTVMVDFIRYLTRGMDRVKSDYYLGRDWEQGDNSDNGHHVIDLLERQPGESEQERVNDYHADLEWMEQHQL